CMEKLINFLKRHSLWVGFMAVLIPLMVLLGMQYVWLTKLERMSAIAHKVALQNYLEALGTEIQYFYRTTAERALNLPASIFLQGHLEKAALHWKKKPVKGARRLFIFDYSKDQRGDIYVYDEERQRLVIPLASNESLAMMVAQTPWQIHAFMKNKPELVGPVADEHDPRNRIILNPITDDNSHIVGVAGMVLDEGYFREELLPATIEKAVEHYFPAEAGEDLIVTVRDGRDRTVLGPKEWQSDREGAVTRAIPFVFTDWSLGLFSRGSTPEQWARTSFAFNMTLSALLAFVLLGGVILALREANKAWKLSEMKSDFVSNVSHELRTPLASIRVFAELLRLGKVNALEKAREYGEYIEGESYRLSRLIDNILDFSRIETRMKSYQFTSADVSVVVESVIKSFEIRIKQCGIHLNIHRPAVPLPAIRIDSDAIGQALNNLLDNAVKYSKDSKEISVRFGQKDGNVWISVQDQGIGIPSKERKKIFERFHRISTGLVHDIKGNGLGLSIVRHIVEAHGGRVTVDSEMGKGSTFTIILPVLPVATEDSKKEGLTESESIESPPHPEISN
ncbi:MAG: HAMP domain-containing sensor histidine kinase, partial [Acidobacteriota bacterium]